MNVKALFNNLNISFSKSFLAFFLFSLLIQCVVLIFFWFKFLLLYASSLILTHASGKFVKFWYGLHTYFESFKFNIIFRFSTPSDLLIYIYLLIW